MYEDKDVNHVATLIHSARQLLGFDTSGLSPSTRTLIESTVANALGAANKILDTSTKEDRSQNK